MFGDIFPTLHVAAVIMHAALVVVLFYRFPRKIFYPHSRTIFIDLSSVKETDVENHSMIKSPIRNVKMQAKICRNT